MFNMLIKFLKTYTIWGQYINDKHYNSFYYLLLLLSTSFIFLNIALYF